MNKKFTTSQITLLGLMIAILLLMAYTPLGYLNILFCRYHSNPCKVWNSEDKLKCGHSNPNNSCSYICVADGVRYRCRGRHQ